MESVDAYRASIEQMLNYVQCDPDHIQSRIKLGHVSRASIIWINQREAALDTNYNWQSGSMAEYEAHIIKNCAFHRGDDEFGNVACVVDRYGGSGIGTNGGSGRSAFINGYYVKGIGRTDLVSTSVDEHHASGGCFLQEAMREAIYGEILNDELPGGAIGVLAIIDLDRVRRWPSHIDPPQEREVLIVRRTFLRPAHFMRAYQFDHAKPQSSKEDNLRTNLIHRFSKKCFSKDNLYRLWNDLGCIWARQLAYSYAHRISNGPVSPSNVDVFGRVVDFGGVTALPSWNAFRTAPGGQISDDQFHEVCQALSDILFYHSRQSTDEINTNAIFYNASQSFRRELVYQIARIFGLRAANYQYYEHLGLEEKVVSWATAKLSKAYDFFTEHQEQKFPSGRVKNIERRSASELAKLFEVTNNGDYITKNCRLLYKETLRAELHKFISSIDEFGKMACAIDGAIRKYIVFGRRDSKHVHSDNIIGFFRSENVGAVIIERSTVLYFAVEWATNIDITQGAMYRIKLIDALFIEIEKSPSFLSLRGAIALC